MSSNYKGKERRRSNRYPILDSFSFFVVIPKKGDYRLPLHDLSQTGISFTADMMENDPTAIEINSNETLDIHLFLNQSLYLPLKIKAIRVSEQGSVRKVGAEWASLAPKSKEALDSLIHLLSALDAVAEQN